MDNVLDVFRSDAFSFVSMVSRFDSQQFVPGQAVGLGIWTPESINTRFATIELRDQMLTLVDPSDYGSPGSQVQEQARVVKQVEVPHFQQNAIVRADEIIGIREFGTANSFQTVESVLNRKLQIAATNFDGTEEAWAINALQGTLKLKAGGTYLDLYTLLGVSKESTFTLPITASNAASANGDGSLLTMCNNIVRKTADNLRMGGVVPMVWGFATSGLMNALVAANEVRTNFQRFREIASLGEVGAFLRQGSFYNQPPFYYGGIWWQEYRGAGIAANHAATFPIMPAGYQPLYPWYYAPADYIETANTMGRPRYAKVTVDPSGKNKFVDLETQMNGMPICLRPTTLMDVTFS